MMKKVRIPNRDIYGYIIGVKKVKVNWRCPYCGEKMGETKPYTFYEKGKRYTIDIWYNKCGHAVKHHDLEIIK
ncbi:hypothetical protein BEH_07440 [Priestia filamentosa]|uniref:Uncharacterized protein n=1 Tax=Priestia filamentosa TaxID=1402861 RepID=A0A0H4KGL3_9BACI|nr:hypothetical protein [Priestia filamentosa]AKO91946.1 hypothetical protein BEH_07440 [Priestia filamentosa]